MTDNNYSRHYVMNKILHIRSDPDIFSGPTIKISPDVKIQTVE